MPVSAAVSAAVSFEWVALAAEFKEEDGVVDVVGAETTGAAGGGFLWKNPRIDACFLLLFDEAILALFAVVVDASFSGVFKDDVILQDLEQG